MIFIKIYLLIAIFFLVAFVVGLSWERKLNTAEYNYLADRKFFTIVCILFICLAWPHMAWMMWEDYKNGF